jgi:hypothetical protein
MPKAPGRLVVVLRWLDFIGILNLASQFGGVMDQDGKTLGANVGRLALVLQGHQGNFLFRFLTVQASFHNLLMASK